MVGYRSDRDGRSSNRSFGDRNSDRNFGNRDRGRRSFGDRGGFGGRSRNFDKERKPLEMFKVTCDKCKKECEVPFKPTSNKPVYCSECFKSEGGDSKGKSNQGISLEQFNQINAKLDKIIEFLSALEVEEEIEE